jgi:hypothetical protein
MPEKNVDVIRGLEARLAELRSSTPSDMPAQYLPVIFRVGEELIEAAKRAEHVQKHLLTVSHSSMKLTPKDEGFKRAYDPVDYEMLVRTGTPQIHSEAIQTAQALEKLTERGDNDGLRELVGVLQQQVEQNNQLIQMLLAERGQKPNQQPQPQKK